VADKEQRVRARDQDQTIHQRPRRHFQCWFSETHHGNHLVTGVDLEQVRMYYGSKTVWHTANDVTRARWVAGRLLWGGPHGRHLEKDIKNTTISIDAYMLHESKKIKLSGKAVT